MWPTWSWQFPDTVHEFLVGHQISPRTAKPAPQAQEHLTNHRNHWPKVDQENMEQSSWQGNCQSMLNTASDSLLYCLTPASTPYPTFDPHSTHITVKSELHCFEINDTVTSVLFSRQENVSPSSLLLLLASPQQSNGLRQTIKKRIHASNKTLYQGSGKPSTINLWWIGWKKEISVFKKDNEPVRNIQNLLQIFKRVLVMKLRTRH